MDREKHVLLLSPLEPERNGVDNMSLSTFQKKSGPGQNRTQVQYFYNQPVFFFVVKLAKHVPSFSLHLSMHCSLPFLSNEKLDLIRMLLFPLVSGPLSALHPRLYGTVLG